MAVPEGIALIGLGISLWRTQTPHPADTGATATTAHRRAQPGPMTTQPAATTTRERRGRTQSRGWPVPAALVVLSAIPLTAGTLRLVQLAGGPALMPADDRFTGFPTALVVHIVGAAVFALVGILQFVPRHPPPAPRLAPPRRPGRGRRRARRGRVGTVADPVLRGPARHRRFLLYVLRLVFVSAMAGCLVLGFTAIRRRDIAAHRAWMIRAYALGLGAGTQVFTEGFGGAIFGTGVVAGDLAKGAAWVINLAVAEWVIRRPARRRNRRQRQRRPAVTTGTTPAGAPS